MIARRAFLLLPAVRLLRAAVDEEIRDVLAVIASALADNNLLNVFAQFDPGMPQLSELRAHLEALTAQAAVASSIVVLEGAQEEDRYEAALDWMMEIRPLAVGARLEHRRERVRCSFRKQRRKWRITSLEPVAFFAPLKPTASAAQRAPHIPWA
jgi:hypothetical protein